MAQHVNFQKLPQTDPLVVNQPKGGVQASNSKLMERIVPSMAISTRDPAISGNSINHGFTVADWTWFQRTLSDFVGAIHGQSSRLDAVFNVISTPGAGVVYQAFGTPSTTYSWTAVLQMIEDYHAIGQAQNIGDSKAENFAKATMVQDATLAAGGLAFAGYRTSAIAAEVKGVTPSGFNAPTILGRIAYGFVTIGIIFFTLYYLILSTVLGVRIYHGEQFRNKLEKSAGNAKGDEAVQKQFEFLQKRLTGPVRILDKLSEKYQGDLERVLDHLNQDLSEEALSHGTKVIEDLLKTVGEKRTKEQIEGFLKKQLTEAALLEYGKEIKLRKVLAKREAKLARLTSKECVEAIKTASTPELKKLAVEKVKKTLDNNRVTFAKVIAACMLGAVGMAAGLFISTGVGAIVIAVIMIIVALAMIKLDSDSLKESLASEAPRKLDKILVKISMALCIASIATVVSLVIAGLIVASPYIVLMSALLSLIWLVYNMKTLRAINEKERKFAEEHPTLETLLNGIKAGLSSKELNAMIDKLPKETQKIFREEFFKSEKNREDAVKAALETMQRVADLQKIRNAELMIQLSAIK